VYNGKRGIDPALVPLVAQRAHAAGLRVSAHIETATDFHVAVSSDVDIIAHMPASWRVGQPAGYSDSTIDRYLIDEADARLAAERNVAVVTTLRAARFRKPIRDAGLRNLKTLRDAGVRIAIGSDNYEGTSISEADTLNAIGAFDKLTLLKLLSETTPQVIFPNRKIGSLRDGYEASFLVLAESPIEDFANFTRIELRVKQGAIVNAE
jgi:imidazolonepropionase-like amidohydrolase